MKVTKKEILKVEYGELEELIRENYNPDYELVVKQGWSNDSDHSFIIDGLLSKCEEKFIKRFKSGRENGDDMLDTIMNHMCTKGLIEPGEYLVTVCW